MAEDSTGGNFDASPNVGDVFDMFEGYDYDLWDAVFELVDNSFDSFRKYQRKLKKIKGDNWEINIILDNKNKTFRITDNAYGMDRKELERALVLAKANESAGAIGKYGMGLKTAASWLGKHWIVRTKKLGSNREWIATVDIANLKKTGSNYIPITSKPVKKTDSSYTVIDIIKGCRSYGPRTQATTKQKLEISYQRFLTKQKLELNWKGIKLAYKRPKFLSETIKLKDGKSKKITHNFKIKPFEINGSKVKGSYGIYEPTGQQGSKSQVPHAGVTMFWRNRVILTRDRNFWPPRLFGKAAGDLARQRLFLHLDVELTPNSLKKDFLWSEYTKEKLEKEIIKETDKHILETKKLATKFRAKKGKLTGAQKKLSDLEVKQRLESTDLEVALKKGEIVATGESTPELDDTKLKNLKKLDQKPLKISINKGKPNVEIYMGLQHETEPFLTVKIMPKKILCFVNAHHPFYTEKVGADPEMYQLYLEFCASLALARWSASKSGSDVDSNTYLSILDLYLRISGENSNQ